MDDRRRTLRRLRWPRSRRRAPTGPTRTSSSAATLLQGDGFAIRAAGPADIINAKTRADRPKDREALPELRALRDAAERNAPDAPQDS
jgi:hypothetical protein